MAPWFDRMLRLIQLCCELCRETNIVYWFLAGLMMVWSVLLLLVILLLINHPMPSWLMAICQFAVFIGWITGINVFYDKTHPISPMDRIMRDQAFAREHEAKFRN